MKLFVDTTGRPGPATWELGSYPEHQEDYPVGGVSWYEAAAYAEFAGKSVPAVAHWQNAAGTSYFSEVLNLSNFGTQGPAPVGKFQGVTRYGAYDMAGNLREWCFNAVGEDRALLGGAWNEAAYHFRDFHAADPMERLPANGFRCAKFRDPQPAAVFAPRPVRTRNPDAETPVSDETFRAWRASYAYDRTPLDAKVEAVDDSSEYYRKEKITFAAAYGGERVVAWLFLPKNAAPPFQTVIYSPSAEALISRDSSNLGPQRYLLYILRSGRALLHPIYQGTYERQKPPAAGPSAARQLTIQKSQDLGRSIDYLETRPDIDRTKLAYYGISMGCSGGVVMVPMEPRIRVALLAWCGIPPTRQAESTDPLDFAPRFKIPVLLLNGRNDFVFPHTTSQLPLFRLLGTPEQDKKMFLYDSGHVASFTPEMIREALAWLDKYLGPPSGPK